MSRYIDAEAIKEKAWQAESEACFYALEDVVSVTDIDEADGIDLVRCAECKHSEVEGRTTHYLTCPIMFEYETDDQFCTSWLIVNPEDFCSRGERKESEL